MLIYGTLIRYWMGEPIFYAELFMRYWIELKMSWNAEFLVQLVMSQIGVLYVLGKCWTLCMGGEPVMP